MYLAVEIDDEGYVNYAERLRVKIYQPFDLSSFPWDQNTISFSLESFRLTTSELILRLQEEDFEERTREREEWSETYLAPTITPDEEGSFSRVVSYVVVTRKSGHYLSKILFPLILIIIISSSVFWMSLENMYLGHRLSLSFTSMLTVVAFDFVTAEGLPRSSYRTSLDLILIFAYFFSAIAIGENVVANWLKRTGRDRQAHLLDLVFRFVYPPLFVVSVIFIWFMS